MRFAGVVALWLACAGSCAPAADTARSAGGRNVFDVIADTTRSVRPVFWAQCRAPDGRLAVLVFQAGDVGQYYEFSIYDMTVHRHVRLPAHEPVQGAAFAGDLLRQPFYVGGGSELANLLGPSPTPRCGENAWLPSDQWDGSRAPPR